LIQSTFFSFGQKGFMHPEEQIDFVKERILKMEEPFLSAYNQLLLVASEALSSPNQIQEIFYVPGFYENPEEHRKNAQRLQTDAFKAYANALAYRLGAGNEYGRKACKILHEWAQINKRYSGNDGSLVMAYSGSAMIIAAQLMSNSNLWGEVEKSLFDLWVKNVYWKACNEIRNRPNNWADWGRFGSLLCSTYFTDEEELQKNMQLFKSDIFNKIASDGSMPEEIKREKNGIWYTYFSLAPMTASCWIIYNSTGENLFCWEKGGISIKTAIDYLFYYNQHPDEWKWYKNPNIGKPNRWPGNLLEAMAGIYRDASYEQFLKPNRPLIYPEHHFVWTFPTLMPLTLEGYRQQ